VQNYYKLQHQHQLPRILSPRSTYTRGSQKKGQHGQVTQAGPIQILFAFLSNSFHFIASITNEYASLDLLADVHRHTLKILRSNDSNANDGTLKKSHSFDY
jgi:hypothetical protein